MATEPTRQIVDLLGDLVDAAVPGMQPGLQVAAYLQGQPVVDAWAGVADPASGRPVTGDTLFTVYSAGKAVVATCVHLLAERGSLDYDTPIAAYWPAFAANGKERVTVRHALTHRAGVPYLPPGTNEETIRDWEAMCAGIAALPPEWAPGTRMGYHALTFGWVLGEVVRRVDSRSFGQFVHEEIARPLGLDGQLYFGIPAAAEPRVAAADPGPLAAPADPDSPAQRADPDWVLAVLNRPEGRRACLPATNGLMTARALARHYAALIGAGVDGGRLLSPERVAAATVPLPDEPDVLGFIRAAMGLGYLLGGPLPDGFDDDVGGRRSAFGHHGAAGIIGFADPDYGLAVGITMTTPGGGGRLMRSRIAHAVRAVLGVPQQHWP